jgi:hypothetical protein
MKSFEKYEALELYKYYYLTIKSKRKIKKKNNCIIYLLKILKFIFEIKDTSKSILD